MLTMRVSASGAERTWRQSVATRAAQAIILGLVLICTAVPGLWVVLLLNTQLGPETAGWMALVLTAPACGLLAWRILALSVTLTLDTLVIRNILITRHVPLADITRVGFRRGLLTVTHAYPTGGSKRLPVRSVAIPFSSYLAGLRTGADAIAETIASAAGLPPLPPRREIVSRTRAWGMLAAAAVCFALGIYSGPGQTGNTGLPFGLRAAGGALYGVGGSVLALAYRTVRDHRRKRRQSPAGEQD